MFTALVAATFLIAQNDPAHMPGEEPVAPYMSSNTNAGATPITDPKVFEAFGGQEGISRIVDRLEVLNRADPRIGEIFKKSDPVRLPRLLKEQFCYILGGPCSYSGRDMKAAHKNMGLEPADMNALVENLQTAMTENHVPFGDQNKLLAKLAPQKRDMMQIHHNRLPHWMSLKG